MPGLGHHDIVFDPNTAPAWQINTRLDGHDHARLQQLLLTLTQSRRLVNIQAEAMAETMAEIATEPGFFNDAAGDAIHVVTRNAGPNGLYGSDLGF